MHYTILAKYVSEVHKTRAKCGTQRHQFDDGKLLITAEKQRESMYEQEKHHVQEVIERVVRKIRTCLSTLETRKIVTHMNVIAATGTQRQMVLILNKLHDVIDSKFDKDIYISF